MNVKIVEQNGNSCVVKYLEEGKLQYGVVPSDVIDAKGNIPKQFVSLIIPCGEELYKIFQTFLEDLTPEIFMNECFTRGIYNVDRAFGNMKDFQAAVRSGIGIEYGRVIKIAKQFKE